MRPAVTVICGYILFRLLSFLLGLACVSALGLVLARHLLLAGAILLIALALHSLVARIVFGR